MDDSLGELYRIMANSHAFALLLSWLVLVPSLAHLALRQTPWKGALYSVFHLKVCFLSLYIVTCMRALWIHHDANSMGLGQAFSNIVAAQ